jgi:hypothetical protein
MRTRWPLIAAILYVVFGVVGLFFLPNAPAVSASGADVVRYLQDNTNALRLVAWLTTVSVIPFVLLVAATRDRLVGIGRDVMLVGGTAIAIMTTIYAWTNAGLALNPDTVDPATARTVTDIAAFYGPTLTMMVILLVAPVGIAAYLGVGGLPRWLAWVSLVMVIEQSIETITVFGTTGFTAPGGDMNFVLGAGLYLIWILCAGIAVSSARTAD